VSKRYILQSVSLYTFLTFLQPALNFLLLPLYVHYLSIEEYGIYNLMQQVTVVAGYCCAFYIQAAVRAFYHQHATERPQYISSYLAFITASGIGFFLFSLLFGKPLFNWLFDGSIAFYPYGLIAVANGILITFMSSYLIYLQHEKKVGSYARITIIGVGTTILLQVIFFVSLNQGLYGALLARLLSGAAVTLIIGWSFVRLNLRHFILHKKYLKPALRYSILFLPGIFLNWAYLYNDRLILLKLNLIDLRLLGIYSFLFTLAFITQLVVQSLMTAIQPLHYECYQQLPESRPRLALLDKLCIYGSLWGVSAIVLVGSNIDMIISNKDYLAATPYLPVFIIAFIFDIFIQLFNFRIVYKQKSQYYTIAAFVTIVCSIALNIWLVPQFQVWGIIMSAFVSRIISVFIFGWLSQRVLPVSLPVKDYIVLPMLVMGILVLFYYCSGWSVAWRRAGSVAQLLLISGLLYYNSRQYLNPFIGKLFSKNK
jgi:O-antigen/teichoic acid export membrane protein